MLLSARQFMGAGWSVFILPGRMAGSDIERSRLIIAHCSTSCSSLSTIVYRYMSAARDSVYITCWISAAHKPNVTLLIHLSTDRTTITARLAQNALHNVQFRCYGWDNSPHF